MKQAVEELKAAWLKQDKAKLEAMDSATAELQPFRRPSGGQGQVHRTGSWGRKATVKSLEFPEMTVQVVGNTAIVRHLWVIANRA